MAQYSLEESQIKRQQMLARALQESGNIGADQIGRSAGGRVLAISPFETLNAILSSGAGAYYGSKAEKGEKELDEKKKADAARALESLTGVLAGPSEMQDLAIGPLDLKNPVTGEREQVQMHGEEQNPRRQALSMALQDWDKEAAVEALRGAALNRAVPAPQDPYTLTPGAERYDANNNKVASGAPLLEKPAARQLVKIVDPSKKEGYETIDESQWQPGMQEWTKPDQEPRDPYAIPPGAEAQIEKLANAVYNLELPPMPMSGRNPMNAQIMARVTDIAAEKGKAYNAFEYPARAEALKKFSHGPQGNAVRSFNVVLDHLSTMEKAAEELNNGKIPDLNRLGNWFQRKTGGGGPQAAFETLKANVRGEIAKAIVGGQTAEKDREEALGAVAAASSPAELLASFKGLKDLAIGQLTGLGGQFVASTGLDDERFKKKLSPAALALYEKHNVQSTPEVAAAGGWSIEPVK